MKRCGKCKETKPLSEFARDRSKKDGLQHRCKACQTALAKAWNHANWDRYVENVRRHRKANPEMVKQWDRERHIRDHDKRIAAMADYTRRHPQKAATRHARRRALLAAAPGSHTEKERELLIASYSGRCAYCPARAADVDHVTPLSRGGCNHIENLVPACMRCNRSKKDKTLLMFLFTRAGY